MYYMAGLLPLAACSVLDDVGLDSSTAKVERECSVTIRQGAIVRGNEEAAAMERVSVEPDCSTVIEFEQELGADADADL